MPQHRIGGSTIVRLVGGHVRRIRVEQVKIINNSRRANSTVRILSA